MPARIFIRIPSYRDTELGPTVQDAIAKAADPARLSFGICEQDTLATVALPRTLAGADIRCVRVPHSASRGVGWARAICAGLYEGEDYTLSLDSHHRFVAQWDRILVEMFERIGNPKTVLTTYPPAYELTAAGMTFEDVPNRVRFKHFSPIGATVREPVPSADLLAAAGPEPTAFYAAGFAFSSGRFLIDVPPDPSIYFQGEEDSMAARAFTHGYDMACPHRILCWHLYYRWSAPKHWSDHVGEQPGFVRWSDLEAAGIARFRRLVGIDPPLPGDECGRFGLGTARTLSAYETFAGISYARGHAITGG